MGTEIFPDANAAAAAHPAARAGRNAHRGDRTHVLARARRRFSSEVGPDNVAITSDFVGVVPSSYPVNLIHLFTSGPQEAIIQVALKPDAPRGEALRETTARTACGRSCRTCQVSFEAGDIVSQVMSFGSPTPDRSGGAGRQSAGRLRVRAEGAGADWRSCAFLRDLQFAQELNYPDARYQYRSRARRPIRSDHGGRGRARSCRPRPPRASPSRTTGAIRIPATRFRFRWSCRRTACRASKSVGRHPGDAGRPPAKPQLTDIAAMKTGHHAGADRALQRAARGQPDGEHSRHHAGRSGAEAECRRWPARALPPQGREREAAAARFRRWNRPSPACGSACCWRCW